MKHGAIRTVKNGAVVIGGVRYRPREDYRPYDGRLDGLRYLFGRYPKPGTTDQYEPFVSLWGTEAMARAPVDRMEYGPELVDGAFPWDFWYAEEADRA